MAIRSMTGFAQVKGQVTDAQGNGQLSFTLSLKSVNHRFLDVHFRMPSGSDSLEMKLRRLLKDKLGRGHVELTLNLERGGSEGFSLNRQIVGAYIQAFRVAAAEYGLAAATRLECGSAYAGRARHRGSPRQRSSGSLRAGQGGGGS